MYLAALDHLEKSGIPYRAIRTEFVGCANDTEYLGKLHCLRLAFKHIMSQPNKRNWWVDSGRKVFSDLLVRAEKDPKDFVTSYDDIIDYLGEQVDCFAKYLSSKTTYLLSFFYRSILTSWKRSYRAEV